MNVRDYLNQNSAIVTVVAVALLGLSLVYLVYHSRGSENNQPRVVYFYDPGNASGDPLDHLFEGKASDWPPVAAPSGESNPDGTPVGVRAWVFSCGDCADHSKMYIAYLEKYTPEYKEALKKSNGIPPNPEVGPKGKLPQGRLIATPENPNKWVEFHSGEGYQLMGKANMHCGSEVAPVACFPGTTK